MSIATTNTWHLSKSYLNLIINRSSRRQHYNNTPQLMDKERLNLIKLKIRSLFKEKALRNRLIWKFISRRIIDEDRPNRIFSISSNKQAPILSRMKHLNRDSISLRLGSMKKSMLKIRSSFSLKMTIQWKHSIHLSISNGKMLRCPLMLYHLLSPKTMVMKNVNTTNKC